MAKSIALVEWSKAIKARDGKCQHCGSVHDLHAHHVKPKSTHPELALDPANGITLCYRCHKAEHERNRPPRVRGIHRPQRRKLERQIVILEAAVAKLKAEKEELEAIVLTQRMTIASYQNPFSFPMSTATERG